MKREELMAMFLSGEVVELSGIHPTYHDQTGNPLLQTMKGRITSIKRIEPYLFQVNFCGGSGLRVACAEPTYAVIREWRDAATGAASYATPLKLPFTNEAAVKNWLKNYLNVADVREDEVLPDPHSAAAAGEVVQIYYAQYPA